MRKKVSNNILFIISSMMIFICFLLILAQYIFNGLYNRHVDYIDFKNGWVTETGESANLGILEDKDVFYKKLGNINKDQTLFIILSRAKLKIYIDDKLIYNTYDYDAHKYSKSSGSESVKIDILREYSNKNIKIEVESIFKDINGTISDMYIGDSDDIVASHIAKRFPGVCIDFVIIAVGLGLIILYFPLRKSNLAGKDMLYLGVLGVNLGLYISSDNIVLKLIYDNENLIHYINQMWMMLLVLPAIMFISNVYEKKPSFLTNLLSILCVLVFAANILLTSFKIIDVYYILPSVHFIMITGILYILGIVIHNLTTKDRKIYHSLGVIILCVGCLMDIAIFYFVEVPPTIPVACITSVITFLIEIIAIILDHLTEYTAEVKNELLLHLAYYDGLTDIMNRTSFNHKIDDLENQEESVTIMMFDVNELKKANDTYGHKVGDELIKLAANSLSEFFGEDSYVYRLGGDEFVVIDDNNLSDIQAKSKLTLFQNYIKDKEVTLPIKLSIASGYAKFDKKKHNNLDDTFKDADKKMYRNKNKMKKA